MAPSALTNWTAFVSQISLKLLTWIELGRYTSHNQCIYAGEMMDGKWSGRVSFY